MTKTWTPGDHSVLMDVDSYKGSHFLQYAPKTEYISSYIEARGGKFDDHVFLWPSNVSEALSRPAHHSRRD